MPWNKSNHEGSACTAYNFVNQPKQPDRAKNQEIRPEKDGSLKIDQLRPGSEVFTDQFV